MCIHLQTLFRRGRAKLQLDEELQFHLDEQIAENITKGMGPDEARHAALRLFGGPTQLKEQTREIWGFLWLENFIRDLRHGARTLLRTPSFAVAAILVIALGIGATTALFTIVRSVLLEPLPFKDPSRLVGLYEHSSDDKFPYNVVSGGVFAEWKKQNHGFSDLAIFGYNEHNLSGPGRQLPEKITATECSWTLFPALGIEPALGRSFTEADDQPSANATVVLSWGFWKRRFAANPAVVGQTLRLDGIPHTIIGVMPAWFTFPAQSILWTPLYHDQSVEMMTALERHRFLVIGRLRPGENAASATSELSGIVRRLHDQHLDKPSVSKGAESRPLLEDLVGDIKTPLYMLLAATSCLLLIACLNVASLLIARGAARRKEFAVRAALGGSNWRLLGGHLSECWILSAAGGALGLLMAYGAIQWFVRIRQDFSRVENIHIDGIVVLFAAGLIFLAAIVPGFISSLSLRGNHLLAGLQESSRSHSAGQGRVRMRKWLLSIEVGLTVVLLIGAGLLLKSYAHLRSSNLGCITANVLTMRLSLPDTQYNQPIQRAIFFETFLERVRSLPGVRAAAIVSGVPGQGYLGDNSFEIAEHPPLPLGQAQYAILRWADPGYFEAIGIPFLRGQTFDSNQRLDQANEAVISDSFARVYFPSEDPLGKHLLTLGGKPYKIVGVVGDTRFDVAEPPQAMAYVPLFKGDQSSVTLAIRSTHDVSVMSLPAQQIVQQLDPELAVSDILTMDQLVGESTLDASFNAELLAAFAALSLVLAAVGLFGVLSYIVSERATEIGIRMALGAQRGEVLRLMLSDGIRPAAAGLLLGIVAAAATAKLIRDLLYGVQPLDGSVFAAVAVLLLAVAAAACLLPAWRASRLDLIETLRNE